MKQPIGFIGLGDMGSPIATNMTRGGFDMRVYDKAGTAERAADGATPADSTADLAASCETICMCVPDGKISCSIVQEIIDAPDRITKTVIDHSTTGVNDSEAAAEMLKKAGMTYIDCPVSGGRAGAAAGTITMIWAGPAAALEEHRALIESASGNIFHVGDDAGQGQTVKLLNNFLSATAMAATAEAVAFGVSRGVDMKTILDVVNVSSGMSTATADKYPKQVLTEAFDAGFRSELMNKDVRLYVESVIEAGTESRIGKLISETWDDVDKSRPGSDLTEVYKHVTERN